MDELTSFLDLLLQEEEFRVNKGKYKNRIRKTKKSDFYKFLKLNPVLALNCESDQAIHSAGAL